MSTNFTLTGGTIVYPSVYVLKFPLKMQGKEVKRILTVKQWLELKEAQIYQQWYNENVAPGNVIPKDIPDEILNLKTLNVNGSTKPLRVKLTHEKIKNLSDWLDETDDGI
jgi:hypothetical protein